MLCTMQVYFTMLYPKEHMRAHQQDSTLTGPPQFAKTIMHGTMSDPKPLVKQHLHAKKAQSCQLMCTPAHCNACKTYT